MGVPSVLVAAEDHAATEHIVEGVNGFVSPDLSPQALAAGVVAAHEGGPELRTSTAEWFAQQAPELDIATSMREIVARYRTAARAPAGY
jgi:DNA-binding NarL/FixJ family response regulator